jgi:hypothetical protein
MKRQKYTHKKEKSLKNNVVLCTECGEALDMFGIAESEIDLKKVKERHKHCKETGKFKGDKCAMLFIAEEDSPLIPDEDA